MFDLSETSSATLRIILLPSGFWRILRHFSGDVKRAEHDSLYLSGYDKKEEKSYFPNNFPPIFSFHFHIGNGAYQSGLDIRE